MHMAQKHTPGEGKGDRPDHPGLPPELQLTLRTLPLPLQIFFSPITSISFEAPLPPPL